MEDIPLLRDLSPELAQIEQKDSQLSMMENYELMAP